MWTITGESDGQPINEGSVSARELLKTLEHYRANGVAGIQIFRGSEPSDEGALRAAARNEPLM